MPIRHRFETASRALDGWGFDGSIDAAAAPHTARAFRDSTPLASESQLATPLRLGWNVRRAAATAHHLAVPMNERY